MCDMKWNKVEDKIPLINDDTKESDNLLCLCGGKFPVIAFVNLYGDWEFGGSTEATYTEVGGIVLDGKITHWVEIPKLP